MHSRYQKVFWHSLDEHDRRIRQRRIPRPSLLPVAHSPWRKALASQDDQTLITITGFDYDSLKYIFSKFAPVFEKNTPFLGHKIVAKRTNRGRKRMINAEDGAGLVLMWSCTQGSMYLLQMIFLYDNDEL